MLPVTHHSTATWKHPLNMVDGWQFDRPDVWQHLAKVCENAKFDFFFSADTEGIYAQYKNSWEPSVQYAVQVPCFDTPTIMSWIAAARTNSYRIFGRHIARKLAGILISRAWRGARKSDLRIA